MAGVAEPTFDLPDVNRLEERASVLLAALSKLGGVRVAEVFVQSQRTFEVDVEGGNVTRFTSSNGEGFGARAFDARGGLGFASSNRLAGKPAEAALRTAARLARATTGDADFSDLPHPAPVPAVEGLVDPRLGSLRVEDLAGAARDLVDGARGATAGNANGETVVSTSGYSFCQVGAFVVVNSNGVLATSEWTYFSASAEVVASGRGDQTTGWWHASSVTFDGLDPISVGERAAGEALSKLGRRKLPRDDVPLIATPRFLASVLLDALLSGVDAELVQRNRSFLCGAKPGEKLAAESFSLHSDATIPGRPSSASCDGEGVPCGRVPVVEGGRLASFLHDSYTAAKWGVQPTGNAFRGSFSSLPSIGPANAVVAPGEWDFEEIVAETRAGLLVDSTGDDANVVTGEFSGTLTSAFWVEQGEVAFPVKDAALSFDVKDALAGIDAVGRQREWVGSAFVPRVRFFPRPHLAAKGGGGG
ncbi:MAG: TldD/PmbA family protein [Promethearchaeota archaeon]